MTVLVAQRFLHIRHRSQDMFAATIRRSFARVAMPQASWFARWNVRFRRRQSGSHARTHTHNSHILSGITGRHPRLQARAMSTEIPVNQVARIVRLFPLSCFPGLPRPH